MFNKLLKAAAIGAGVYAVGKAGETVGYIKGLISGVRTAAHNPEWAAENAAKWDKLFEEWKGIEKKA